MTILVVILTLAVAFFNGANDVSKAVATLVGSGVGRSLGMSRRRVGLAGEQFVERSAVGGGSPVRFVAARMIRGLSRGGGRRDRNEGRQHGEGRPSWQFTRAVLGTKGGGCGERGYLTGRLLGRLHHAQALGDFRGAFGTHVIRAGTAAHFLQNGGGQLHLHE